MALVTGPTPPARVLLTEVDTAVVAHRFTALRDVLAAAAKTAGRDAPPEVLVASKYFDPVAIPALVAAGVTLLGENRADVIEAKQVAAAGTPASADLRWDYIGELQSRKAASIAPLVSRIHTLASESAVRKLVTHAESGAAVPTLLVQVNVAGEAAKGGVDPDGLPALLEAAASLSVDGLMTMPPLAGDPAESGRWFAALRELAAAHGLAQLSMGTSQDAVVAAEQGATVVRIGGLLTSDDQWERFERSHG
ncbi:MAG: YggS family pyridoxal phosphate enzyme [Solirubrobacteraceae bacterium]|nr:YggS family pyridoxal phosphate enzyme [Patulibacter sp.]